MPHRNVFDLGARIYGQAVQLGNVLDLHFSFADVDDRAFGRLLAEDDIFGNRKVMHQFKMLMHHADAEGGGPRSDR